MNYCYNVRAEMGSITTSAAFERWMNQLNEYMQWCHTQLGHGGITWDFKDGFIIFYNEEDYLMFKLKFDV